MIEIRKYRKSLNFVVIEDKNSLQFLNGIVWDDNRKKMKIVLMTVYSVESCYTKDINSR